MAARSRKSTSRQPLAGQVAEQARAVALVWNHAEDWALPRIPPSQLRVLSVLADFAPMNLTRLAKELDAIASSASRLCDRLEAAGLIERAVSADSRREVTLRLSTEGRQRLTAFEKARRDDFSAVLHRMDPDEQRVLLAGLTYFSQALATGHDEEVQTA